MKYKLFLLFALFSMCLFAQQKPDYPKPKKGYKMVILELPKINNENDYKVEIAFGIESKIGECSIPSFDFRGIKTEYLIPPYKWPYYVADADTIEIIEGSNPDKTCTSTKLISRKIISSSKEIENYSSSFIRHFYIPENWTLEYRIWKSDPEYISIK